CRDDRRGGIRASGRTRQADRRARHAGPLLASAREGVHPAGRGRRGRPARAGGVLMSTGTQTELVMPQMGVSVSEGTITKWLNQVGETIGRDEPLLEISTDKVDTEVPSPAEGVVTQILAQEGETVEVGTVIALIGPEGAQPAQPAPQDAPTPEPTPAEQPPAEQPPAEQPPVAPAPLAQGPPEREHAAAQAAPSAAG